MKKKYFVALSYQVIVEALSDSDAINVACYVGAYSDSTRHLAARVVRVELPVQPPAPATEISEGAQSLNENSINESDASL